MNARPFAQCARFSRASYDAAAEQKEAKVAARLLSVNVGLPRDVEWQGKTVRTAVWKEAVRGPRVVRRLNVDGDGQGDLAGHGGEHRAVFVYQMDSYRYWQSELGRNDFTYGQFGENFTVEGLPDLPAPSALERRSVLRFSHCAAIPSCP